MTDKKIVDMNGVEIVEGSRVKVHQEYEQSMATVKDISDPRPTMKLEGHYWVDIEKDPRQGLEGMMTYLLEVVEDTI